MERDVVIDVAIGFLVGLAFNDDVLRCVPIVGGKGECDRLDFVSVGVDEFAFGDVF